jgi:hypothetical protein
MSQRRLFSNDHRRRKSTTSTSYRLEAEQVSEGRASPPVEDGSDCDIWLLICTYEQAGMPRKGQEWLAS